MAGLSAATDQTVYSIVCPVLFGAFLLRTGKGGHDWDYWNGQLPELFEIIGNYPD